MKKQADGTEIIELSDLLGLYRTNVLEAVSPLLLVGAVQEAARNKTVLSCNGCAHCCTQKILATPLDGLVLYLHLKEDSRNTEELYNQLLVAEQDMRQKIHYFWMKKQQPCVFFEGSSPEKGRCTVYSSRPLQCAAMFSCQPSKECADPDLENTFQVTPGFGNEAVQWQDKLLYAVERAFFGKFCCMAMLLPGAVAYAWAKIEGKPLPDIAQIPYIEVLKNTKGTPLNASMARVFDERTVGK
jgi:Fe-S-cluster containining protein